MPTLTVNASALVSHRNGSKDAGNFYQGWNASTDTPAGSGGSLRWTGHMFFTSADFSPLTDMIIDSIVLRMTSTTWGTTGSYAFWLRPSTFKYDTGNASYLDPNDFYPNTDIEPIDYIESPAFARSETHDTTLTQAFLTAVLAGYGIATYRRSVYSIPSSSEYTREGTTPQLIITYHAAVSTVAMSAGSVEAGSSITANITRGDATYYHTVKFTFGTRTQEYTNVATSQAWTVPLAWLDQIPSATSGTCACEVKTYNSGGTLLGTNTAYFTITAGAAVVPDFTLAAAVLYDGLYWTYYIQGKSKATIGVSDATGIYSSTITACKIVYTGMNTPTDITLTGGAGSHTSGFLATVGTNTFTVTITDSRGRTKVKSVTCTVTAYSGPSISALTGKRCNSGGTLQDDGLYAKVTPTYTYLTFGGNNTRTTAVYYRVFGSGSGWTTASTDLKASGEYWVIGGSLTATVSYEIKVVITDLLGTTATAYVVLPTAAFTMDFRANGLGIGIGKAAEADNIIDIAPTWDIKKGTATYVTDADYTAADVLAKLLTVDGTGSGIDADSIDGIESVNLARAIYSASLNASSNSGEITLTNNKTYLLVTTRNSSPYPGTLRIIHGGATCYILSLVTDTSVSVTAGSGDYKITINNDSASLSMRAVLLQIN